jgi:hypothetical protein
MNTLNLNLFLIILIVFILCKNKTIEQLNNFKYKIVIGGCARNCGPYLPKVLPKIKEITNFCSDYQIIIYENDSTDNTLELLNNFKNENKNVLIISEKDIDKRYPLRTHRLAYTRNKIIDEINENNYMHKYDYFLNIDLDNINVNLDIDSIKKLLDSNFEFDVATANHKKYYDYWALRTKKYNKNCCNDNGVCFKSPILLDSWFDKIKGTNIDKNAKPIKVLSAFEGLGIYKLKSISNCRYDGIEKNPNSNEEDCEHVKFHECIRDKGNDKIYIIPYLNHID